MIVAARGRRPMAAPARREKFGLAHAPGPAEITVLFPTRKFLRGPAGFPCQCVYRLIRPAPYNRTTTPALPTSPQPGSSLICLFSICLSYEALGVHAVRPPPAGVCAHPAAHPPGPSGRLRPAEPLGQGNRPSDSKQWPDVMHLEANSISDNMAPRPDVCTVHIYSRRGRLLPQEPSPRWLQPQGQTYEAPRASGRTCVILDGNAKPLHHGHGDRRPSAALYLVRHPR